MSNSIFLFSVLIFLSGCQSEIKETKSREESERSVITTEASPVLNLSHSVNRKVLIKKDFSNIDEFKENINNYLVSFKATSGHFYGADIECFKSAFDRSKRKSVGIFDEFGEKAVVELSIDLKDPNDVQYTCQVIQDSTILESLKISLKKSVVVSGTNKSLLLGLSSGPIDTILFEEGSVLVTDGSVVNIEADTIISQGGKITTFNEAEVSDTLNDQNGSSGGVINLNVKNSFGKLAVELRGKDGGLQTKVPSPILEIPTADPSLNGTCRGTTSHYRANDQRCFGQKGHRGIQGMQGFSGLAGGDSGFLNFKSSTMEQFKLEIKYFPGKGSPGGVGGKGGKGGPGGKGSTLDIEIDRCGPSCSFASAKGMLRRSYTYPGGAQGDNGPDGERGDFGKDGEAQISTLEFLENLKLEINTNWQNE
jgi:hypothetical protein